MGAEQWPCSACKLPLSQTTRIYSEKKDGYMLGRWCEVCYRLILLGLIER